MHLEEFGKFGKFVWVTWEILMSTSSRKYYSQFRKNMIISFGKRMILRFGKAWAKSNSQWFSVCQSLIEWKVFIEMLSLVNLINYSISLCQILFRCDTISCGSVSESIIDSFRLLKDIWVFASHCGPKWTQVDSSGVKWSLTVWAWIPSSTSIQQSYHEPLYYGNSFAILLSVHWFWWLLATVQ